MFLMRKDDVSNEKYLSPVRCQNLPPAKLLLADDAIAAACAEMK